MLEVGAKRKQPIGKVTRPYFTDAAPEPGVFEIASAAQNDVTINTDVRYKIPFNTPTSPTPVKQFFCREGSGQGRKIELLLGFPETEVARLADELHRDFPVLDGQLQGIIKVVSANF